MGKRRLAARGWHRGEASAGGAVARFRVRRRLLLASGLAPWLSAAPATITVRPVRIAWVTTELPAFDGWAPFARHGNLLTYGPVLEDVYRRLAYYVDRIVKGAKPGDLPIELPTKVELVVNQRTAKALGITIPLSVLVRADEVLP